MFARICKRSFLLTNRVRISVNPDTHLGILQLYAPKTSSASEKDEVKRSFRVNYLVNSCFLSLESAKSVAEKVRFVTPERHKRSDAVLDLFKSHGFTCEQISRIIRLRPELLQYDAKKTLLPKLEFFISKQVSSSDVAVVIARQPSYLFCSLMNVLIPCYDFFKSVLLEDQRVLTVLKRAGRRYSSLFNLEEILGPNLSLMRKIGLPESSISFFLYDNPQFFTQKPKNVDNCVRKALNLGLNPSQARFVEALETIFKLKESTWERKMEAYRGWGLSDDEILAAFRKSPRLMAASVNKISNTMDFFVNKMGWKASAIAKSPGVFITVWKRGSFLGAWWLKLCY